MLHFRVRFEFFEMIVCLNSFGRTKVLPALSHLLSMTCISRDWAQLHFTYEEAEAWLGQNACTRAHGYSVLGPGLPSPEFLHLFILLLMFLCHSSIPFMR